MLANLLLAGLIEFTGLAAANENTPVVGDGFIKYSLTQIQHPAAGLARRQHDLNLTQHQNGNSYTIQLGIGTPPQPVSVQVDTGSTELWVNPNCANTIGDTQIFCNSLPRYDPRDSSTYKELSQTLADISYGLGNVSLIYSAETITLGTTFITSQILGLATNSFGEPFGILGLAPYVGGGSTANNYSFFLDTLVAQGGIASRAFSVDLRDLDSANGSIIFGGVDSGKFTGSLQQVPIIPPTESPDASNRYWIAVDSIDLFTGSASSIPLSKLPLGVVLDSGTSAMVLPQNVVAAFVNNTPTATLDGDTYLVNCNATQLSGSLDFTFGNKTIKVPYKDMIVKVATDTCELMISSGGTDSDSFMRSVYAVFDQDNRNLHLAQAADCGTNIVAISKGVNAVPSVTGDCGAASSTATPSTTPTSSSTAAPTGNVAADTKVANVGVGIVAAIAIAFL